jgi:succinate dehydrogenase/fumarate reductase flavoprotein subunit
MVNGAVYTIGASSSMGAMVTGARAGGAAAKEILQMGKLTVDEKEVERKKRFIYAPKERKGGYSPRWVTQLLQNTMMPYFILYIKRADRLQAALTQIEFMQEHLVPKLFARDPHELRLAHETKNMVLSAEMRLRSSLFRTESRGNHYREDYPRRDDPNWLAWTKIREEQGKMKLIKVPIPKEWWPDLSIPYEKRYPLRFPNEKI